MLRFSFLVTRFSFSAPTGIEKPETFTLLRFSLFVSRLLSPIILISLLIAYRLFLLPIEKPETKNEKPIHRISDNRARNFWVARNNVFFAVSSVVFNISPMVRSFNPW